MDSCKKQHKLISKRKVKNFDENKFVNYLLDLGWEGIVESIDNIDVVKNNWKSSFFLFLEETPDT